MPGAPLDILKLPGNHLCADCEAPNPKWASVNIGILVCEICSGIHRGLGTHISKVKSTTMDEWRPEWINSCRMIGNVRAKAFYEHGAPPEALPRRVLQGDSVDRKELTQWIRTKYDLKLFVPPGVEEPYRRVERGERLDDAPIRFPRAGLLGGMRVEAPSEGRWTCDKCGETNKAERESCNNCGAPRTTQASGKPESSSKPKKEKRDKPRKQNVDFGGFGGFGDGGGFDSFGSAGGSSGAASGFGSFSDAMPPSAAGNGFAGFDSDGWGSGTPAAPWGTPAPAAAPSVQQSTASSTPSTPMADDKLWVIDPERLARYEGAFLAADRNQDGFVEPVEAREVLERSQLPEAELRQIWSLADDDRDGRLTFAEFLIAMHLGLRRSRDRVPLPANLPAELTRLLTAPPVPQTSPAPAPPAAKDSPAVAPPGPLASSTAAASPWALEASEIERFTAIFMQLETASPGFVDHAAGREVFERSQLPVPELAQIWRLCDLDGDGRLARDEFISAMGLIARRRRGAPLLEQLPMELRGPHAVQEAAPVRQEEFPASVMPLPEMGAVTDAPEAKGLAVDVAKEEADLPLSPVAKLFPPSREVDEKDNDADGRNPFQPQDGGNPFEPAASGNNNMCTGAAAEPKEAEKFETNGKQDLCFPGGLPPSLDDKEALLSNDADTHSAQLCFPGGLPEPDAGSLKATDKSPEEAKVVPASPSDAPVSLGPAASVKESAPEPVPSQAQAPAPEAAPATPERAPLVAATSPHHGSPASSASPSAASSASPEAATPATSASASPWAATADELAKYHAILADKVDPSSSGFAGTKEAREVLVQSKLPREDLQTIWDLSDMDCDGHLCTVEFLCAMCLVARRLQGAPLPTVLPPELVTSLRAPGCRTRELEPAASSSASSSWAPTGDEVQKYVTVFRQLDSTSSGFLGASEAREFFDSSGLPPGDLSRVWRLADVDRDGRLSTNEFICAVVLVARMRQHGLELPSVLPPALAAFAADSGSPSASAQPVADSPTAASTTMPTAQGDFGVTTSAPSSAAAPPRDAWALEDDEVARYTAMYEGFSSKLEDMKQVLQSSGLPREDLSHIWRLSMAGNDGTPRLSQFLCVMALCARRRMGSPLPTVVPASLAHQCQQLDGQASTNGGCDKAPSTPSAAPVSTEASATEDVSWTLSPEELSRYRAAFQTSDPRNTGIVGAQEGRELFERSGLPAQELAYIWRLSDVDQDGSLAPREFVCAMAIMMRRRNGAALPKALPPQLVAEVERLMGR